jgi:thioredoxin reductase (NADPH)
VYKSIGGGERLINHYGPGGYGGEVPILLGAPAIASLRASEASRICRLDQSDFRELIAACPLINAQLLQMMATRINGLQQLAIQAPVATVTIIGHRFDLACHALRDFLTRNHVAFRWHDPREPEARIGLPATPQPDETFPVVKFSDGSKLTTPTFREVATRLGLQTTPSPGIYDVAIVGGGPAGLAAAVYGASEGLRTILIERDAPGGQAGTSSRIENYLGFPTGVSGDDLGTRALAQAKRFGVQILVARHAAAIEHDDDALAVVLDDGERIQVRTIVLATGVTWRALEIPGADALVGRGVYYGAARTEALGTNGRDIFLIGGGNSAGQAAMFFADYARKVTLLCRGYSLAASMSHYLIAQLATKRNVEVRFRSQVVRVEGTDHLEAIVVEIATAASSNATRRTHCSCSSAPTPKQRGCPPNSFATRAATCARAATCSTSSQPDKARGPLARDPYLLETSVPGIFAAGDVRHGSIKRVASGVGEGSMAIAFVHQYLAERSAAATGMSSVRAA